MSAFARITPEQLKQIVDYYGQGIMKYVFTKNREGKFVNCYLNDIKRRSGGIYIGHGYLLSGMEPMEEKELSTFKIVEALIFKNKHSLLSVCGMVIQGPKGGKYLLDEFCSEIWLRDKLDWDTETLHSYMMKAAYDKKISICYVELDGFNNFVTPEGYKKYPVFRRKAGLDKLRKSDIINRIEMIQ